MYVCVRVCVCVCVFYHTFVHPAAESRYKVVPSVLVSLMLTFYGHACLLSTSSPTHGNNASLSFPECYLNRITVCDLWGLAFTSQCNPPDIHLGFCECPEFVVFHCPAALVWACCSHLLTDTWVMFRVSQHNHVRLPGTLLQSLG